MNVPPGETAAYIFVTVAYGPARVLDLGLVPVTTTFAQVAATCARRLRKNTAYAAGVAGISLKGRVLGAAETVGHYWERVGAPPDCYHAVPGSS